MITDKRHSVGDDDCREDSHCFSHHIDEPVDRKSSFVCFECGHSFKSNFNLWRENLKLEWVLGRQFSSPTVQIVNMFHAAMKTPSKIYTCPFCAHDF